MTDLLSKFEEIQDRGFALSDKIGIPGRIHGPNDAARHILGSAEATLRYGEHIAHTASLIREATSKDDAELREMDRHNDSLGRELAQKHGNMDGVIDETMEIIGQGSNKDLGAIWTDGTKPSDMPQDWKEKAKEEAKKAYKDTPKENRDTEPKDRGVPREYGEDDILRAEKHANTAKAIPDSEEMDILIKELFMQELLKYLATLDRTLIEQIKETLNPDLPLEERQRLLFQIIRENQLEILPLQLEPDDANNPENRKKLLDAIREMYIGNVFEMLGIQAGWTDPPSEDDLRKHLEREGPGGNFSPGNP